ncbi:MAG TPA: DUF6580 family putative transport protein [Flavisolibacter sp.]|jgi:hypothetical protein|nr:DUF6580 family putative transport protein [Flavisolibacter sp.]
MTTQNFQPRTALLLLFILATGLVRVLFNFNHDISALANFSPLGAMALFGGAYFKQQWKGFVFPLLTLFISDVVLHQTVFKAYGNGFLYSGWYWVYGAIALMTIVGRLLLQRPTVGRFLLSTLVCVLIHWIVTDLGVWIGSTTWPQTLSGFMACLTAAIPFEWRFLTGTLVYGLILFGSFEYLTRRSSSTVIA